jgi:tRNA-dihydrouridine synthase
VLGNGDIWCADDAVAMMVQTGVDGVVVGRGCLGRPWLFADLAATLRGSASSPPPDLGQVARVMHRHAALLAELMGESRGLTDMRKHMAWYLKGFQVGSEVRGALGRVSSLAELDQLLARLDLTQPYPVDELTAARGRQGTPKRVVLPDGWLDDQGSAAIAWEPQLAVSGG